MTEAGTADGWGDDEAPHWVTEADRDDGQLAPFAEMLFDRLQLTTGDRVLDVWCACCDHDPGSADVRGRGRGGRVQVAQVSCVEFESTTTRPCSRTSRSPMLRIALKKCSGNSDGQPWRHSSGL